MSAWLIILISLAGLLLLFAAILAMPVRCRVEYRKGEFYVTYRFFFLSGTLLPEPEPLVKGKRRKKCKKRKGEKRSARKDPTQIEKRPGIDLKEVLSFLLDLLKSFHGNFKGKLIFKIRKLHFAVTANDAAECALVYGAASQALAYFLEAISYFFTLTVKDKKAIRLDADFTGRSFAEADVLIYVNVLRVLHTRLQGVLEEIKNQKNQTEQKNGPPSERKDKTECQSTN